MLSTSFSFLSFPFAYNIHPFLLSVPTCLRWTRNGNNRGNFESSSSIPPQSRIYRPCSKSSPIDQFFFGRLFRTDHSLKVYRIFHQKNYHITVIFLKKVGYEHFGVNDKKNREVKFNHFFFMLWFNFSSYL